MDEQGVAEFCLTHKKYLLPLVVSTIGIGCILFGLFFLYHPSQPASDIAIEHSSDSLSDVKGAAISPSQVKKLLVVDIEGAVNLPGVYQLAPDSRIQDALLAAGGLKKSADQQRITKMINLAAKLSDGSKLYFPFIGEKIEETSTYVSVGEGGAATVGGQININTASATQLDTLSGVGKVTAEKIISNRPYAAIEELVSKKVVSSKVFTTIKDQITIY